MIPLAILDIALLGMMAEALGVTVHGAVVRNVAAGLLVLTFAAAIVQRARLGAGAGLPTAMFIFATWVTARVVFDSGLAMAPLLLGLWFPFTFFAAYASRTAPHAFRRLQFVYLLIASALYLSILYSEQLHGPQMINSVFYVVLALPFTLTMVNPRHRLIGLAIVLLCGLASDKRTALIALVLGLLAAGIVSRAVIRRLAGVARRPAMTGAVLTVACVPMYWVVVDQLQIDILEKFSQLQEDEGSGRVGIYQWVFRGLAEASTRELLFGHGQDAVASATGGISAHNDFLEIAYDFGMIGLVLYLAIYACLFSGLIRLIRRGSPSAAPWAASILVFATMSMLSHVAFVPTYGALLACYWGFVAREFNEADAGAREIEPDPYPGTAAGAGAAHPALRGSKR